MIEPNQIKGQDQVRNGSSHPGSITPDPHTEPTMGTVFNPGRRHVLDLDDFSLSEIESVFQNADAMLEVLNRRIKKVPTLRGITIITMFHEASTRTRVSFEQAGKVLSADVINVSGSGTSTEKGESLYNTALTLQAMNADIIIIRHSHSGAPYFLARHLDASVINAGDGMHAHPTQGLLDLYTIRNHFNNISDIKVVIVGDILHGRVARSNLWGLTTMGARVVLSGPPTLIPLDFIAEKRHIDGHPFANIQIENNVDRALEDADVVMPLRLQLERQKTALLPTLREYSRLYGINSKRMKLAKPDALVMHPGPMNEGVEIDSEVAHGARSVIEEQVTNGVGIRMAVLFGVNTPLRHKRSTKAYR